MSNIYNDFNGCTIQNNEIEKPSKTDIALNYKFMNMFNKTKKEHKKINNNNNNNNNFIIDGLLKIYNEFNNEDVDFIE